MSQNFNCNRMSAKEFAGGKHSNSGKRNEARARRISVTFIRGLFLRHEKNKIALLFAMVFGYFLAAKSDKKKVVNRLTKNGK